MNIVVALLAAVALLLTTSADALAATATPPPIRTTKKALKAIQPPAKARVGRVTFGRTSSGKLVGLVAVRYPIQAANRVMAISVTFETRRREASLSSTTQVEVSAGPLRRPERRRAFTFVHQLPLTEEMEAAVENAARRGQAIRVHVYVEGQINIDADRTYDLGTRVKVGRRFQPRVPGARAARRASKPFCASFPVVRVGPGERASVPLPACDRPVHWSVTGSTGNSGAPHLGGGSLEVVAPQTPGTTAVALDHGTVVVKAVVLWAKVIPATGLTQPAAPVVRGMGDSVTAGFGYYSDGKLMSILSLDECKPFGAVLDDACSSNSTATANGLKEVPYAPDYGLANNISWAAQWANEYGITNYKNFAVSGSEPSNWAPGGNLYPTTQKIEEENPDYILMTIGANPILSETLFGLEPMRCALESDIFGGYKECVERAFQKVNLEAELKKLYTNLVEKTKATIYVMEYHLSIPASALLYSSTQIAEMGRLMNEAIARVVAEVNSPRLQAIEPPHFNVGVNLSPVYPSTTECHYLGELVDGPSVQSTPSQVALRITNPLTFCGGPITGEPWVISGDTGIHPSATGYAQMESKVPPPMQTP